MHIPTILRSHRGWAIAVTLALTAYQIIRLVVFLSVYGGIEHDGGWMLTISRSLAEQGTYTTMVSTLVDPQANTGIDVDMKFNVQASDGRIWFFTGNGIGPASIVPDAFIIKLFGAQYWSLRLGPLLFCVLFLLLSARILYALSGTGAIVLFHGFLFFHPNLLIFLGYEAMGEVPTLCYILLAALAFRSAAQTPESEWKGYLVAGILAGLTVNAKFIGLLSVSGLFVVAAIGPLMQVTRRAWRPMRSGLRRMTALAAGAALPLALWELVQLATLTALAGLPSYLQHVQQRWRFLLDDGSGLGAQIHSGMEFITYKFLILSEVAHPEPWVTSLIFLALLAGGAIVLWRWRAQSSRRTLFAVLWLGWLANTVWFVALAKTGWVRHFYFGLILATLLLPCIVGVLLRTGQPADPRFGAGRDRRSAVLSTALGVLLLALLVWGFLAQPHVRSLFVSDELVADWQQNQKFDSYGARLPWSLVPTVAQSEVVDYIARVPPESRVYYLGGHKTAELPAWTGRIQYPLPRRLYDPSQAQDYLVIGPSLISPWLTPGNRRRGRELASKECQRPVVANDFYMLCALSPPSATGGPSYTAKATAFVNGIRLLGYDALITTFRPGDTLPVFLYWQSDQPIRQNYKVFVQLVGTQWNPRTNNPLWGQSDQEPGLWKKPTTAWEAGTIVEDAHHFEIASDAPPGRYRLTAGMYLADTGERLRTVEGDDHVLLREIEIR